MQWWANREKNDDGAKSGEATVDYGVTHPQMDKTSEDESKDTKSGPTMAGPVPKALKI